MSNDLPTAIADKVIRFQELLRQHATPWAIYERLHAGSKLLGAFRMLLYVLGIACIIASFVPALTAFAFHWGFRLCLSYPVVVFLQLVWWTRLLRHAKPVPCRLSSQTPRLIMNVHLLTLEDLRGQRIGHLFVPHHLFRSYGFSQLSPADQLTALQTRFLFWRLLLPPELIFDSLQPELTNLTQQWAEN